MSVNDVVLSFYLHIFLYLSLNTITVNIVLIMWYT